MKETKFLLYKIYSENCLLYLGRTKQSLQTRLHGHFFKAPMLRMIDISCVTKIEYAYFRTEADMFLYEIYYINKLKPPLNRDDKAKDELTIELPEIPFNLFDCKLMEKWKREIEKSNRENEEKSKRKVQLALEHRAKRREIFDIKELSNKEKQTRWDDWLENYYEPIRNELT